MRRSAGHLIELGFFLTAVCGSLFGQAPVAGQAGQQTPAATETAKPPEPAAPAASKAHDDHFIIGNDDLLAINVWKEPEVSRSLPVRSDGRISLPLVGEVQAAGRTPAQLEKEIA